MEDLEDNEENTYSSKIWWPSENIPSTMKKYLFDKDEIPNFKKLNLQSFYPALGKLLRITNYQYNYATFWFLDIIADFLRNAQIKLFMKKRNQKALIEWFIYCYVMLNKYDDISRKCLLNNFHDIVMKDDFWKHMNYAIPGPHDLGLIPDDEEDYEEIEEEEVENNDELMKDIDDITEKLKMNGLEEEKSLEDDEPPYSLEINGRDLGNIIYLIYSIYGENVIYENFKDVVQKELAMYSLEFPYSLSIPRPIEVPPIEKIQKKSVFDKKKKSIIHKDEKVEEEEIEEQEYPQIQRLQKSTTITDEWFLKHFPEK